MHLQNMFHTLMKNVLKQGILIFFGVNVWQITSNTVHSFATNPEPNGRSSPFHVITFTLYNILREGLQKQRKLQNVN